MNPAALAVHMKTHSDRKYYACPLCPESFDQIQLLRAHAEERHLERTIKAFDPMLEVGSGRLEVRGSSGGSADSLNRVDAGRSTESSSAFTGDSSCAAVAIATATTAIASGVWIGAVYPNGSGSEVAMTMEGELEFIGDVGHCLFAEEVTTNDAMSATNAAADAAIDNDLTQLLELNAEVENSGFSTANKDPSKKIEGTYHCPECHRVFAEFSAVSRHVRLFHSSRSFECKDCGRTFPRRDKLRLHALRHSSHREFVCETCGRQFKRKDKLRDHLRRQHDPSKERDLLASMVTAKQRNADAPAFTPAVSGVMIMIVQVSKKITKKVFGHCFVQNFFQFHFKLIFFLISDFPSRLHEVRLQMSKVPPRIQEKGHAREPSCQETSRHPDGVGSRTQPSDNHFKTRLFLPILQQGQRNLY